VVSGVDEVFGAEEGQAQDLKHHLSSVIVWLNKSVNWHIRP
jgi:hypothetical protein